MPVGERLARELITFADSRRRLPMPRGEASAFFATHSGTRWTYVHVITLFQRVRRQAAVRREPESRYPPRLHDLRHTATMTPELLQHACSRFEQYAQLETRHD